MSLRQSGLNDTAGSLLGLNFHTDDAFLVNINKSQIKNNEGVGAATQQVKEPHGMPAYYSGGPGSSPGFSASNSISW